LVGTPFTLDEVLYAFFASPGKFFNWATTTTSFQILSLLSSPSMILPFQILAGS
jgi:hypothetical protein